MKNPDLVQSTLANKDTVLFPQDKMVFGRGNEISLCSFLIDKCTDLEAGDKTLTKKNWLFSGDKCYETVLT